MTDVHWVKLSTDLFDNRKIKYLRRLPEGDSLALIWIMLLTLAGRCNAGGTIGFTESVPYTPKMLADELSVDENTMLLALRSFEYAEMIRRTEDGFISILGWEDHQNVEGLELIREQNRLRKQRYDANKKALAQSNVTGHVTVTQGNATDIDIDIDTDTDTEKDIDTEIEIKKEREEESEEKKPKQFVPPTLEEVREYCFSRKSGVDPVHFWDYFNTGDWKDSEGKPVRNWKQKLLTWESHHEEKGGLNNDSAADHPDGVSQWNIRYTVDGRTL